MMFVDYPQTLYGLGNGSRTLPKVFFDLSGSTVATQVDLDARGRRGGGEAKKIKFENFENIKK